MFAVHAAEGRPYLARTALLGRRALRLLKTRETASRLLNLRDAFDRLEYWLTGSALDAGMQLYELARYYVPDEYARVLRLRLPPYVKLLAANDFPRTTLTTRLSGANSIFYGPFRSRVAAETFEGQFLELFQIRRCQEDLSPSPDHPGCIYGEMNKCLRPCQAAVGPDEYAREVTRARDFLLSNGLSLVKSIAAARDSLSQEMEFEEAARQHTRLEKVEEVLALRGPFAGSLDQLHVAAFTRSARPNAVDLFLFRGGHWQGRSTIDFDLVEGKPVSVDRKLREVLGSVPEIRSSVREREERLAIFARWAYSTWRDGELLVFPNFEDPPIRKLVNAIARVM